ncbi:MAG: crossover junction endodeoxyribonuclease RuvC [Actinobacteria bacterium]|nr:crossover junction endodeoxyribonuclease RuvC [Actinomycetota bacterium]
MRVLGVDPGLTRCGIGVVEGPPAAPVLVAAELVRTPREDALELRLDALHRAVAGAIARYRPDAVAVERVLFSSNVRSAMATGQAAGVALLAAAQAGVPVTPYSPNDVKFTVAGHGGADKDEVGRMVAMQLRLSAVPRPADVADALAIALTHLARARMGAVGEAGAPAASARAGGGSRGWEAVLDNPHLRVAGGTAPPRRTT